MMKHFRWWWTFLLLILAILSWVHLRPRWVSIGAWLALAVALTALSISDLRKRDHH